MWDSVAYHVLSRADSEEAGVALGTPASILV